MPRELTGNERSETAIAVALTNQPRRTALRLTIELLSNGLPQKSWVKISQIRTLSTERIGSRIGRDTPEEIAWVVEGLNEIIGT